MTKTGRIVLTERPTKIISSVEQNVPNVVVETQAKQFNNSYKSNKIDELYQEFDSITLSQEEIENNEVRDLGLKKRKFRNALILTTCMMVALLFAFLAIFNIFVIKEYNAGIDSLQRDVLTIQSEKTAIETQYENATDQTKIIEQLLRQGYRTTGGM